MRSSVVWAEVAEPVNGVRPAVGSLSFSPSGDVVVAACGVRVLVYAASSGVLQHSLKGHQDTVYCVDVAPDGKTLASGGADRTVILWTIEGEGVLKYQHKASVQAVAYNPVTSQLASVSNVDWGLWSPEASKVTKMALPSKGLCAAWAMDGQTLAIGTMDGTVLLFDINRSVSSNSSGDGSNKMVPTLTTNTGYVVKERARVRRPAPVWTLAFSPIVDGGVDVLAVGSWDGKLSFYNPDGTVAGRERDVDFDPCSVAYTSDGEHLLVSGTSGNVTLFSKTGTKLITMVDAEDWVWCARPRPRHASICCGTDGGMVSCVDVEVTTVHSIYEDQYMYRDKLTNVVVHQLTLDRKMVIACGDYVKKIATYRDRLAVLFADRIIVFELFYDEERAMRYHDIAQIRKRVECSVLCVTANMVLVCKEQRITMFDFQGNTRREWSMDSPICYIKVVGGVEGRELVLVGLHSGQALKLFVDNAFPIALVKLDRAVRCLDLSSLRTKLAVVDESDLLQVYDLTSDKRTVLFSEQGVKAVTWNSEYEDMIAYSTDNHQLHIRTGALPAHRQVMRGLAIGFKANRLFNLHPSGILIVDVAHAYALYRYIEAKDFDSAYRVAARKVAEGDWKMLGLHAMMHLRLDIARRAFTHIREVKLVELLGALELRQRQAGRSAGGATGQLTHKPDETAATTAGASNDDKDTQTSSSAAPSPPQQQQQADEAAAATATSTSTSKTAEAVLYGDVLAFQGKYADAARQFVKLGCEARAIDMFCDLKMWDSARKICDDEAVLHELIRQQARWAEDSQNYVEAATLYETCGDFAKAIAVMSKAGQLDKLMRLCRALPRSEVGLVTDCARLFAQSGAIAYAMEAYEKVNDFRALLQLYVQQGDWRRAFATLAHCPQHAREVYVPWANWLAEHDRFEDALEAFRIARWPQEAVRMMEMLAANSVTCRSFADAAYYYVHLAEELGHFVDDDEEDEDGGGDGGVQSKGAAALSEAQLAARIRRCNECVRCADLYYAYATVYTHTTQPFPYHDVALLRTARYLLSALGDGPIPANIGQGEILYTLARMANRLDMVRTARAVFDRLQTVILPPTLMEQVDMETLLIRCKPLTDREELLDTCQRCRHVVAPLAAPGDRCPNCAHPFVRCFAQFTVLPLVEFVLANDLTDADAERILSTGVDHRTRRHAQQQQQQQQQQRGGGGRRRGSNSSNSSSGTTSSSNAGDDVGVYNDADNNNNDDDVDDNSHTAPHHRRPQQQQQHGGRNDGDDYDDGGNNNKATRATEWRAADTGANVITFEHDNLDYQIDQQLIAMGRSKAAANKGNDVFFTQLQYVTRPGRAKHVYQPYVANAPMLRALHPEEVFVVRPRYGSLPVSRRYYRVVHPGAMIVLCAGCQHFFTAADYEFETMKGNGCPLCRYKPQRQQHAHQQQQQPAHVSLDYVTRTMAAVAATATTTR